jgi:hypothetical protein
MNDVQYRRARAVDYPQILKLQADNYIANLTVEERQEGFLSAQFTPAQTAQMAEDLGTMVAVIDDAVAGFLCAFRHEFDTGSPVIAAMLAAYDRLRFNGRPLSEFKGYIYGPVCIAREQRRRGLLRGLYEAQRRELAGQFDIGVAFVARANPHSLQAHVQGLGMGEAGDFEVNGNAYAVLAFSLLAAERA